MDWQSLNNNLTIAAASSPGIMVADVVYHKFWLHTLLPKAFFLCLGAMPGDVKELHLALNTEIMWGTIWYTEDWLWVSCVHDKHPMYCIMPVAEVLVKGWEKGELCIRG